MKIKLLLKQTASVSWSLKPLLEIAQQAQAGAGNTADATDAGAKKDDIVDAEFEEVDGKDKNNALNGPR